MAEVYRDYCGLIFPDVDEFVDFRISYPAPMFGEAVCPALEYNFSVSRDNGVTWYKPDPNILEKMVSGIREHSKCCRDLGDKCPV